MKKVTTAIAAILMVPAIAFSQNNEQKDIHQMASEAADYLNRMLELEDWQVYQIDSTFLHDYGEMTRELDVIRKKGATNSDLYQQISDKWMDIIDASMQKILSPEQRARYMKVTTYGKAKRERDKRNAKKAARK